MSGDVLSVVVEDVVRLAGRVDAVSDAVGTGVSALSVAPPSDGLGLLVGAIASPVLDMFTRSAHEVLSEAGVHARGTAQVLRDAAAEFERAELESAGLIEAVGL